MRESFEKIKKEDEKKEKGSFGNEKEKGEGLTDKEREVFEKTPEGAILKYLKERHISSQKEFLLTTKQLAKETGLGIINTGQAANSLIKEGVIEADKKMGTMLVKEIHAERIKEFFEKKFDYAEILQLIKEKPGLNTWQISGALYLDWPKVKSRIGKLETLGLIKSVKEEEIIKWTKGEELRYILRDKIKFFFPTEFFEKAEKRNIIGEIKKRREEERKKTIEREKRNYDKETE